MSGFDVRLNLNRASRQRVPNLLELKADLLSALSTRLVVPLIPKSSFGTPAGRLNPVFRIGHRDFVMDTAMMAVVATAQLGDIIASLAGRRTDVLGAVDFLISGI